MLPEPIRGTDVLGGGERWGETARPQGVLFHISFMI